MSSYLEGGWYAADPATGLRTQVIDGAIDVAGSLYRAGVTPELLLRLGLRVRLAASAHRKGKLAPRLRAELEGQLTSELGEAPALAGFVKDCLRHVRDGAELAAFYAHVLQVARMMLVLTQAREAALGAMAGKVLPRARVKRKTKAATGKGARTPSTRTPSTRTPSTRTR